jgi:hypothetical protein
MTRRYRRRHDLMVVQQPGGNLMVVKRPPRPRNPVVVYQPPHRPATPAEVVKAFEPSARAFFPTGKLTVTHTSISNKPRVSPDVYYEFLSSLFRYFAVK